MLAKARCYLGQHKGGLLERHAHAPRVLQRLVLHGRIQRRDVALRIPWLPLFGNRCLGTVIFLDNRGFPLQQWSSFGLAGCPRSNNGIPSANVVSPSNRFIP